MPHRLILCLFITCGPLAAAADSPAPFPWLDPAGIKGAILICGGSAPSPATIENFNKAVGDSNKRIVLIQPEDGLSPSALELVPGAMITCAPLDESHRSRLIDTLTHHANQFGLNLPLGTVMLVRGRQIKTLEGPAATVLLSAAPGRPLREIELAKDATHDLTMLRRAAIERSLGNFPPQVLPPPLVEHGTLFIHGGGEMPPDVVQRFLDLAGGKDAPIVVLPIAAESILPEETSRDTRVLVRAGATNVTSLRARTRAEVESPEFAAAINSARGVWFNGGRQWRFVDAYLGTKAEDLFRDLLRRGGVIGGSSAGASIQSQYMPRGSPLGNSDMMAEGYERGLGFLPGVAVDQHFTQRRRHADMTRLMRRYPQILGIGLDEGTALVVRGSTAEIIGRGRAHFYDHRPGPPAGDQDCTTATQGQRYNLLDRTICPAP